jgi:transmembrane sensor
VTSLAPISPLPEFLLDEASSWVARLSSDRITESDLQAFALWLAENNDHKLAYDEIAELWLDFGAVKHLPITIEVTHQKPEDEVVTASHARPHKTNKVVNLFGKSAQILRSWPSGIAVAASIFFAIAVIPNLFSEPEPLRYITAVGESTSVSLADGSVITLNTNTRLEVLLSEKQRRITLEHGEAFFEVAKDPNRPFIVNNCSSEVQAIGTAFSVRCNLGSSSVAVTEGIVQVTDSIPNRSQETSQMLTVGEGILLSDTSGLTSPNKLNVDRIATWRHGELIFNNTLLSDVLNEINRYSNMPVGLGSPELRNLRVTGRFGIEDRELLLKALKRSLSLSSETSEDGTVRLVPLNAG